jgi:hypothetical protein
MIDARRSSLAAALAGALLVTKGTVLLVAGVDLSLVPSATLLFAFGLLGLDAYLRGAGASGWLVRLGRGLAWLTVGASVVNLVGLARGVNPSHDPLLSVGYLIAFLGILVGLPLLGMAGLGVRGFPSPWRLVPLAVGVVWFPIQALALVAPDGVGLVLGGLTWVALGLVPLAARGPMDDPAPRAFA